MLTDQLQYWSFQAKKKKDNLKKNENLEAARSWHSWANKTSQKRADTLADLVFDQRMACSTSQSLSMAIRTELRHQQYLPATTVPPTVVAFRLKRAETVARAQFPEWELTRPATNQCR